MNVNSPDGAVCFVHNCFQHASNAVALGDVFFQSLVFVIIVGSDKVLLLLDSLLELRKLCLETFKLFDIVFNVRSLGSL